MCIALNVKDASDPSGKLGTLANPTCFTGNQRTVFHFGYDPMPNELCVL